MNNYNNAEKYKYAPIENGAFFFPTDEGCYIAVGIEEGGYQLWQSDILMNNEKIFSIEFERSCDDGYSDFDDSVCNTIYKIITSNIESKGDLCVYYHHFVDHENYYDNFYAHFYDEIELLLPNFETFEFPWVDDDGESRIIAVIMHRKNPDRDLIIDEFKKTISISE